MNVFLSFAPEQKDDAELIEVALRDRGSGLLSIPDLDGEGQATLKATQVGGISTVIRRAILTPHCLTRNVTEQVSANDWGGVTESARCRRWREGSAWARGARGCRRWRSATGRPSERGRGASSMSCARRRAGIASM